MCLYITYPLYHLQGYRGDTYPLYHLQCRLPFTSTFRDAPPQISMNDLTGGRGAGSTRSKASGGDLVSSTLDAGYLDSVSRG